MSNVIKVLLFSFFLGFVFSNLVFVTTQAQAAFNNGTTTTQFTNSSNAGNNDMGTGGNDNSYGSGNGISNDSTIQTGDVTTHGVITNQVNTNIIKTGCNCTPTPTQVVTQPTATPTPGGSGQVATPTPTSSTSNNSSSSPSSSSGASSSPAQAVLGASAMASTGTFMDNVMDMVAISGIGFLLLGLVSMLYKKGFALQFELQY